MTTKTLTIPGMPETTPRTSLSVNRTLTLTIPGMPTIQREGTEPPILLALGRLEAGAALRGQVPEDIFLEIGYFRAGAGLYGLPAMDSMISTGHFGAGASVSGFGWLSGIRLGRCRAGAGLRNTGLLLSLPLGHLGVEAVPRFGVTASGRLLQMGRFGMGAGLSGAAVLGYPLGRFTAAADIIRPSEFVGWVVTTGRLSAEAAFRGGPFLDIWWETVSPSVQRIYACFITGTANGVEDLEIPISSLQYRLYSHGGSYLSVVIPNAVQNTAAITARKDGQIVLCQGIRYADGSRDLAEMARAGKISIRHDTGGRNSSITLTAGERLSFSFDPAIPKRSGPLISTALQADGQTRIRCAPVFGLFPGDTVQTPQGNYVAERISVSVGRNQATMEILTA